MGGRVRGVGGDVAGGAENRGGRDEIEVREEGKVVGGEAIRGEETAQPHLREWRQGLGVLLWWSERKAHMVGQFGGLSVGVDGRKRPNRTVAWVGGGWWNGGSGTCEPMCPRVVRVWVGWMLVGAVYLCGEVPRLITHRATVS